MMHWLALALILVIAKLCGHVAIRLKQPAVLGELLGGIVMGNLHHLPGLEALSLHHLGELPMVEIFAEIGVIILLFTVGLESTVKQMFSVGLSSLMVATLGVAAPFILGLLAGIWWMPQAHTFVHIFIGATLTATSVGITARVLRDLGQSKSREAHIILGAAVIDDVMGLVVLAVVTAVITAANVGQSVSLLGQGMILIKAVVFLTGALFIGHWISPRLFRVASRLQASGVLLVTALAFCFLFAWLSTVVGLAPIVGAFAAGLVLEDIHYQNFIDRGEHALETLIHPIADFTVPVFFILMGLKTNISAMMRPDIIGLAMLITVAAIVGKQVSALGAIGTNLRRLTVGIGMVPRGEVGLIFANLGMTLTVKGKPLLSEAVFAAIVFMVLVTTLITPPLLKWSFRGTTASLKERI